jgi:hypothetical protein
MNRKPENDELLSEVFAADFREALLGETLRRVRHRRQIRRAREAAAVVAILGLVAILIWKNFSPMPKNPESIAVKPARRNYTLVRSQPLPANAIVTTRALSNGQFVAASVPIGIVETTPGNFRFINDDELLALMASHPVALVRIGPHAEKLVFVNPEDQKDFPAN